MNKEKLLEKPILYKENKKRANFLPFSLPSFDKEEETAVIQTLRSGWVTKGPKTEEFEGRIKRYVGSKYAIGTNSCTSALELSLIAIGVGNGDEVITTPITFPSTANVIVHRGAKPVFVDIEKGTFNIDADKIEKAITNKTKAIIPVHFAGHPCQMDKILKIAEKYGLFVIEDAAHAFGSEYHNKMIGNIGDLTCFSFYATKNITTGEGGMVTTNDERLARKIDLLSSHGISSPAWKRSKAKIYRHWEAVLAGYNYHMYDIQAAIGLVQLKKIGKFLKIRGKYAQIYNNAFKDIPEAITPSAKGDVKHSYHLYVIMFKIENLTIDRDKIMNILQQKNIGIGMHYRALHLQPFYREKFGFKRGSLPVSEYISDRIISLPLYPKMSNADVRRVIDVIRKVINKYRKKKIF